MDMQFIYFLILIWLRLFPNGAKKIRHVLVHSQNVRLSHIVIERETLDAQIVWHRRPNVSHLISGIAWFRFRKQIEAVRGLRRVIVDAVEFCAIDARKSVRCH
mgnify:CR=1 FL=1